MTIAEHVKNLRTNIMDLSCGTDDHVKEFEQEHIGNIVDAALGLLETTLTDLGRIAAAQERIATALERSQKSAVRREAERHGR